MLCTRWDPGMFTSIKYIKSSRSVTVTDLLDFMHDDNHLKGRNM